MVHLQKHLSSSCQVRCAIEMNDLRPHKKKRLYLEASVTRYYCRVSLYLIEFTSKTLAACELCTVRYYKSVV